MMRDIPVYDWEGKLVQYRSLAGIQYMLERQRLTVHKDKRGTIRYAVLRTPSGDAGVSSHIPSGMKSTHIERLPSGRRCWSF